MESGDFVDDERTMKDYAKFKEEVAQIKRQYARSKATEAVASGVRGLAVRRSYHPFVDMLIRLGESCIEDGDYGAGITWIKSAGEYFPKVNNKTLYFLRMAEYHIENGDMDTGVDYLTRLCMTYGESCEALIGLQGMTAVWEKYKHLVADLLPEAVPAVTTHRSTSESTMSAADILALSDDDLLTDLSAHLNEMCANGEYLNSLNKWERMAWYVDELCMELNAGGFEGYLYYHGTHFEKAYKALEQMGAAQMTDLLDKVQSKFPRGRIPKSETAIQNAMDALEEKGVDFENEDDVYYDGAERELLARLTAFVRENAKRFR